MLQKFKNMVKKHWDKAISMSLFLSLLCTGLGISKNNDKVAKDKENIEYLFSTSHDFNYDSNIALLGDNFTYRDHTQTISNSITNEDNEIIFLQNLNKYKIERILEKYELSLEEFNVVVAIVLAESKANSYEDAYAVINTIYNRTKSVRWNASIDNYWHEERGRSLYYQAIHQNQFVVYQSGAYLKYLNDEVCNYPGYQAVIDMLYDEIPMHNYLKFLSSSNTSRYREQFVEGGNNYYSILTDEDLIDESLKQDDTLVLSLTR